MKYGLNDLATGCEASVYLAEHETAGAVLRIVVETSPLMGVLDLTPAAWEELKAWGDAAIGKIGADVSTEQPVVRRER